MTEEEAKKPRIARDNEDGVTMEDIAEESVVVMSSAEVSANRTASAPAGAAAAAAAAPSVVIDGSTTDDSTALLSSLISVKSTAPTDALDDREIVRRLHPIVFRVVPYEGTDSLLTELAGVSDFLRLSPSIASARREDIRNELFTIYGDARSREALKVPVVGDNSDVVENSSARTNMLRVAAVEMRYAILYGKLKIIDADSQMVVYTEVIADVQSPGTVGPVIIRREDREFWARCIQLSSENHPVCGVGNPGIGKTTTTIYLLQRLLTENKPVVYTIRKKSGSKDVFYEFTPVMESNQLVDVTVKVYEIMPTEKERRIPTMNNSNAVYFVDPGKYEHSCDDTDELFEARFMMAASNDSKHWGGANFTKLRQLNTQGDWQVLQPREQRVGKLIHGSLWSDREILYAKPYLKIKDIAEDEVLRRFRMVGGSIRDIIEFDESEFTEKVAQALNIQDFTVQGLADGTYQFSYTPDAPSSVLIGIGPKDESLERQKIVLKSDYVEEQLAKRHLKISWYAFLNEENHGNRGNLFESYLREKFSSKAIHFTEQEVRESLRTKPPKPSREIKNYEPVAGGMTIGSPRTITRVSNMNDRVRTDQSKQFMFYSKNQSEPLTDMIFRVDGGYDSIQSTVGKKHGATPDKIGALKTELNLADGETLRIFFVVPESRYAGFLTDPANPLYDQDALQNVHIYHVSIS